MVIKVNKFGIILNGRPSGREAALILKQLTRGAQKNEEIIFDFEGVMLLAPSFADEFFQDFLETKTRKIGVINIKSPVILDTLKAINFPNSV